jgi:hypothetical protein
LINQRGQKPKEDHRTGKGPERWHGLALRGPGVGLADPPTPMLLHQCPADIH